MNSGSIIFHKSNDFYSSYQLFASKLERDNPWNHQLLKTYASHKQTVNNKRKIKITTTLNSSN